MYVQWGKPTYTTLQEDVNGFHCQCFFLFFIFFFSNVPIAFIAVGCSFAAILQFTDNQILEHHSNKY